MMPRYIFLFLYMFYSFSGSAMGQTKPGPTTPSNPATPAKTAPLTKSPLQLPEDQVDFKIYNEAMKQWFGMRAHNNVGSMSHYSQFEDGASIHLRNLLKRTKNWKVVKTVNYGYLYNQLTYMTKNKATMQTSQAPLKEEEILSGAYIFLTHVSDDSKRLIAKLEGSRRLYVMYNSEPGFKNLYRPIAELFMGEYKKEESEYSIYKGKVLELKGDRYWDQYLGFFKGVDNHSYTWDDFIFLGDEKDLLKRTIDQFITKYNKTEWKKFGLPQNRGVLLHGPPGTGKSFVSKVIISNILRNRYPQKVTYIHVQARHILESDSIRNIYNAARQFSPSIVFFEDVDLIAGTHRRDKAEVKNEFMQQLSGIESLEGVITIATTNLFDMLDPALKRSKRLGYHHYIGLPSLSERVGLFENISKKIEIRSFDPVKLAGATEGMNGADINEIISLAIEKSLKMKSLSKDQKKASLFQKDLLEAVETKKKYRTQRVSHN